MKKHQLLLCVSLLSSSLIVKGQEEAPTPPIKDSPLIELIKKSESKINFNTLESFNDYRNIDEVDLNRKTVSEEIILASQLENNEQVPPKEGGLGVSEDNIIGSYLPADVLSVDDIDFDLSGYNKIKPLGKKMIILGADTVKNCFLVEVSEIYFLRNWLDTITQYENTYYSFVKDGNIILEIFNKKRLWKGGLAQLFDGVSINKVGQNPPVQIVLTPNPASTDCIAQFNLYKSGMVILRIVNQNATINKQIFKGKLEDGNQSVSFSVKDFTPGVYTVFLEFDNKIYYSNLIIN